jgi:hypothetical protein
MIIYTLNAPPFFPFHSGPTSIYIGMFRRDQGFLCDLRLTRLQKSTISSSENKGHDKYMDHRRCGVTFTTARGSNDARCEADKRNSPEHIETFKLPSYCHIFKFPARPSISATGDR